MTEYDPDVIQKFVDTLYRKANGIIAIHTLLGLLGGGVAGFVGVAGIIHGQKTSPDAAGMAALFVATICAFAGGAIGHNLGSAKALQIKLAAQTALCQKQIEINTRHAAERSGSQTGKLAA